MKKAVKTGVGEWYPSGFGKALNIVDEKRGVNLFGNRRVAEMKKNFEHAEALRKKRKK